MSVNDDLPALHRRARVPEPECHGTEARRFSGVCLGAQMMATALGGRVEPSGGYQFGLQEDTCERRKAIGRPRVLAGCIAVPLVPTLHGECFTVPEGATRAGGRPTCCCRERAAIVASTWPSATDQFLRLPVRAATDVGGTEGTWDRVFSGGLQADGQQASDPAEESAMQPAGVRQVLGRPTSGRCLNSSRVIPGKRRSGI